VSFGNSKINWGRLAFSTDVPNGPWYANITAFLPFSCTYCCCHKSSAMVACTKGEHCARVLIDCTLPTVSTSNWPCVIKLTWTWFHEESLFVQTVLCSSFVWLSASPIAMGVVLRSRHQASKQERSAPILKCKINSRDPLNVEDLSGSLIYFLSAPVFLQCVEFLGCWKTKQAKLVGSFKWKAPLNGKASKMSQRLPSRAEGHCLVCSHAMPRED